MSQTIAIILKIGEDSTEAFEQLFEREILPLGTSSRPRESSSQRR